MFLTEKIFFDIEGGFTSISRVLFKDSLESHKKSLVFLSMQEQRMTLKWDSLEERRKLHRNSFVMKALLNNVNTSSI